VIEDLKPEIFLYILEQHLKEETEDVLKLVNKELNPNFMGEVGVAAMVLNALTNAVTKTRLSINNGILSKT